MQFQLSFQCWYNTAERHHQQLSKVSFSAGGHIVPMPAFKQPLMFSLV